MTIDYKEQAENLRAELERIQDDQQQVADAAYERRERERYQRAMSAREAQCYADNWDEAFRKAIPRLRREASSDAEEAAYDPNDQGNYYFTRLTAQHVAAYELWKQEQQAIQPRIDRIRERAERLIAALEQPARERIADQIESTFPDSWILVENLREDNYSALVEW